MASLVAPLFEDKTSQVVQAVSQSFARVAVFEVSGTQACLVHANGIERAPLGIEISLREQTPLRFALEAASPVVGAGRSPHGDIIALTLGMSIPRAYAVIPVVDAGRLSALIYADAAAEPLPLATVGEAFALCHQTLADEAAATPTRAKRHRNRSLSRHPTSLQARRIPWVEPAVLPPPLKLRPPEAIVPPVVAPDVPPPTPVLVDDNLVVTPRGVVRREHPQSSRRLWPFVLSAAFVAALVAVGFLGAALLAPPPTDREQGLTLTIAPKASVSDIARVLEERQVIKNGFAFTWLARLLELDRNLRAGTYELPQGAWAWTVVQELSRGQVHSVRVTIPEGLTLKETAALFEHQGLTSADAFMQAAHDKDLLEKYDLGGTSAEGFLFPETYTFARGLSAKEMVEAMLGQFFERIARIPEGVRMSAKELRERIILASIIEKEARDKAEQARIAGVFQNRLDKNMKLESCATVLYVLGTPKARLTLADVRTPSPFNTYLNVGLPPGPIANPGFGAIRAAFRPESNDYLFFFAKDDGSYQHIFTKSYADHQREQQRLSRR